MSSPIFLETRGPLSVCLLFPTFDREGYEKCFASAFYLYVCMRARARECVYEKNLCQRSRCALTDLGPQGQAERETGHRSYLNDSSVQVPVKGEVAAPIGFIFQFSIEAIVWGNDFF